MPARGQLHGVTPAAVERAIDEDEPFTGDAGFAGALPDGRIVRDVLGRYPVFVAGPDRGQWSFDPRDLMDPQLVDAGTVLAADGTMFHRWELPTRPPFPDRRSARDTLARAISDAWNGAYDDAPIGFSGGVDSALLAAQGTGPLYTVSFPNETDLSNAQSAALELGRSLRGIELDHAALRRAIPTVARATGRATGMDMAIALSLFALAEAVVDDGYDRLILGQGADELFGGYEKIAHPDRRVEADSVAGARREVLLDLPGGLARDVLAVRAAGVEPVMPYLADGVVQAALRLRAPDLVRGGRRKALFRDVADRSLPSEIAGRDKTAIQYGNGVARELDRLARRAGYKRHQGKHVERYVNAVLNDH